MQTNPYKVRFKCFSHNGTCQDPTSGIDLIFTVKSSVELVRRARAFYHLHKAVTPASIGFYDDTGRVWLKRFAGHIKAIDGTLDQITDAYAKCRAAAVTCLALLEGRMKLVELSDEIGSHPWVRGTAELVLAIRRGRLTPEEASAVTAPLIERFKEVMDATMAARKRHAERTSPESNHAYVRNVALMNVRVRANQQLKRHYGWSEETAEEHGVTAGLVLKSYIKRIGKPPTVNVGDV